MFVSFVLQSPSILCNLPSLVTVPYSSEIYFVSYHVNPTYNVNLFTQIPSFPPIFLSASEGLTIFLAISETQKYWIKIGTSSSTVNFWLFYFYTFCCINPCLPTITVPFVNCLWCHGNNFPLRICQCVSLLWSCC